MACACLALINVAGTVIGLTFDERWYGMGFTLGTAVAVVYAMHQTNFWLNRIDYETFTSQPIYDQ
jgi:uncharacterized membrane protein